MNGDVFGAGYMDKCAAYGVRPDALLTVTEIIGATFKTAAYQPSEAHDRATEIMSGVDGSLVGALAGSMAAGTLPTLANVASHRYVPVSGATPGSGGLARIGGAPYAQAEGRLARGLKWLADRNGLKSKAGIGMRLLPALAVGQYALSKRRSYNQNRAQAGSKPSVKSAGDPSRLGAYASTMTGLGPVYSSARSGSMGKGILDSIAAPAAAVAGALPGQMLMRHGLRAGGKGRYLTGLISAIMGAGAAAGETTYALSKPRAAAQPAPAK